MVGLILGAEVDLSIDPGIVYAVLIGLTCGVLGVVAMVVMVIIQKRRRPPS